MEDVNVANKLTTQFNSSSRVSRVRMHVSWRDGHVLNDKRLENFFEYQDISSVIISSILMAYMSK